MVGTTTAMFGGVARTLTIRVARRALLALAVGVMTASGIVAADAPAHAAAVLGAEAAAPVKAWFGKLKGLKVKNASVAASTVDIAVGRGCTLRLAHPSAPPCEGATEVGDAVACWVGKRCPKEAKRAAALEAAGPLKLPWRATSDAGADAGRSVIVAARQKLEVLLAASRVDGARAILLELVGREDVRPREWFSLLPVLAATGGSTDAWKLLASKTLKPLGAERLSALRITLTMGPVAGSAAAAAVLDGDSACEWSPLASAFLTARAWEASAELAAAIRAEAPGCLDAYVIQVDAAAVLGRMEAHAEAARAALDRFGDDPATAEQLAPVREAWDLHHGDVSTTFDRLVGEVRATSPVTGKLLRSLVPVALRKEGRGDRLLALQAQAKADPTDVVATYLAGAMLRFYGDREAALPVLEQAATHLPDDRVIQRWIAADAYLLGDRAKAERALALAAAGEGKADPEVMLLVAELSRDTDPRRAQAALEQYWEATSFTLDPRSDRQIRVAALRESIKACVEPAWEPPCAGPWNLVFDARKQKDTWDQQLVEDAEKVKEWEDARSRRKTAPPKELPPGAEPKQAGHQGEALEAPAPIRGGGDTHDSRMAKEFGSKKDGKRPPGAPGDPAAGDEKEGPPR